VIVTATPHVRQLARMDQFWTVITEIAETAEGSQANKNDEFTQNRSGFAGISATSSRNFAKQFSENPNGFMRQEQPLRPA